MFEKIYRPALLILLTLILIVQTYDLYTETTKNAKCSETINLLNSQIQSLSKDYEKDVYNNPKVDNINKQMLINNEYQFFTQVAVAQLLVACQ